MIPFVLKSVHNYFQDLLDFLLYSLGQISEGAGMSEGPGEDCTVHASQTSAVTNVNKKSLTLPIRTTDECSPSVSESQSIDFHCKLL